MSHQYMPFSVTSSQPSNTGPIGGRLFQVSVDWLQGASTSWQRISPTSSVVSPNSV